MITVYPYKKLGSADYGWLKTRYHFSFSGYRNPSRMHFGALRVINDDRIAPHEGFDTHSHNDMEIITYVRTGAITHRDSMGHEGRTEAGDVQVMSAGKGIAHSEFNLEEEDTTLYQIWISPNKIGVESRWEAKQFPKAFASNALSLLVSGRKEDKDKNALFIHQDAAIYGGRLKVNTAISHPIKYQAYVLVSEGKATIEGTELKAGDGAEVTDEKNLSIKALEDAEIIIIDVPALS